MIGPMSDDVIRKLCENLNELPMIDPFVGRQIINEWRSSMHVERNRLISYGLSSYGYDIRVANEFQIFSNSRYGIIDPKDINSLDLETVTVEEYIIIPPNAFALARSVEYLRIPRNVIGICIGKSTYARCGLVANITALEPEWEGHLTIELSNTAPLPIKVYANEGIAQLIFFSADRNCAVSYKDKKGKYQGQTGITPPRV